MRHGEAWYNVNSINYKVDTYLTEDGRKSVAKTGLFLADINFDYIFSSPLYRTIQTTQIILDHLVVEPVVTKIKILHCSNEVPFCKTGKCDSNGINLAPENISMCNINPRLEKCSMIEKYPIDWSWYRSINVNGSKTNFVSLILLFVTE